MGALILVRAVIVLLVVRLVGRFLAGVFQGMRETAPQGAGSPEMVRDQVCNTFLPRDRALTVLVGGQEAHFCSPACRDRALSLQPAR
jgi:hypothetical protein